MRLREVLIKLLTILLLVNTIAAQTPPSTYNAVTDRIVYNESPMTGVLDFSTFSHQRNYVFTDISPFNSTSTRITDATFDPCSPGQNFIPPDAGEIRSINLDSTKFYVQGLGGAYYPMNWNPNTMQASRMGSTTLTPCGGIWLVGILDGGSRLASWSGKNANIMWGTSDYVLRRLDFSTVNSSSTTVPFTNELDFAAVYSSVIGGTISGSICSLGVSGNDATVDYIATGFGGSQDLWKYAIWYNTFTGAYKILDTFTDPVRYWNSATSTWTSTSFKGGWTMHNVKIDQGGRFVRITAKSGSDTGVGLGDLVFWDTTNNNVLATPDAYDGGHIVTGYGTAINQYANGSDATQWLYRNILSLGTVTLLVNPYLSDPSSIPQYLAFNPDFDEHTSYNNARSTASLPVISATSRDVPVSSLTPKRPFDNEILAIRTDVQNQSSIFRLAFTHSIRTQGVTRPNGSTLAYYDYSFQQVSPDGKWVLYNSNMNLTLTYSSGIDPNTGVSCAPDCRRVDTFMLKMPISIRKCNWETAQVCN